MRTSVTQLTPAEIEELLQICAEEANLPLGQVETVDDEDPDDDGHGEVVSYHPHYRVKLFAALPNEQKEHLEFKVWEKASYEHDEWDCIPWEIHLGEIVMPMGLSVAPVKVVKWFLDHGFQLWGDQPPGPGDSAEDVYEQQRIVRESNEEFIRILSDPATKEVQDACTNYIRSKLAHGAELDKKREALLDASAKSPALREHLSTMSDLGRRVLYENAADDFADQWRGRKLSADEVSAVLQVGALLFGEGWEEEQRAVVLECSSSDERERALEEDALVGFPIGRALAVAGALGRGEEPKQEDVQAIDAWRDAQHDPDAEIYDEIDPVWWRGNDAGVHGVLDRIEEALAGKYDDEVAGPYFGSQRLMDVVHRVRDLRKRVTALQRIELIAGECFGEVGLSADGLGRELRRISEIAKEAQQ